VQASDLPDRGEVEPDGAASRRTTDADLIVTGRGFRGHGPETAIVTTRTSAGISSAAGRGGGQDTMASAMITDIPLPMPKA